MLIESIDGESRPVSSVKPSSSFACVARGGFLHFWQSILSSLELTWHHRPRGIHNRERVLTDTRE
jgi:hypothetical protein